MTDDGNEPTPWEDINPTRTALALRVVPASVLSERLPATRDDFRRELTACLALVAPVGMSEDARTEWLKVAWGSLNGIPADLLTRGCAAARRSCDHPAKIVPAIIAEIDETWAWRKKQPDPSTLSLAPPQPIRRSLMDRRGEAMTEAETEELNAILEGLGATARYRADGSRYVVEKAA